MPCDVVWTGQARLFDASSMPFSMLRWHAGMPLKSI